MPAPESQDSVTTRPGSGPEFPLRIFVYGTLRRGGFYHDRYLSRARFLGLARTALGFVLTDLGRYPGMIRGGSEAVIGELYEVDAESLSAIDELEDHPEEYQRGVISLADGGSATAYLFRRDDPDVHPRVPSGDWFAHRGLDSV